MEVTSALGDAERGGRVDMDLVSKREEGEERSLEQLGCNLEDRVGNRVHMASLEREEGEEKNWEGESQQVWGWLWHSVPPQPHTNTQEGRVKIFLVPFTPREWGKLKITRELKDWRDEKEALKRVSTLFDWSFSTSCYSPTRDFYKN